MIYGKMYFCIKVFTLHFRCRVSEKTLHSFLVDNLDFHVHPLNLLPILQKIFAMHSSLSHPIKA